MRTSNKKKKAEAGRNPKNGHFQNGNRIWEARSTAGPKPKFKGPDELWSACIEYFEWVDVNPLYEDRLVTFQGAAKHEPVAKMRAMTIAGLCLFIDISQRQWQEWRTSRPDLLPVMTKAEEIIYEQKFSGAAADLLNPNIIARDLGLKEKSEVTGSDDGPIRVEDKSMISIARSLAFILAAGANDQEDESDG